jgi:antitoxin component of MazEF toxin-antitoxin module
VKQIKPVQKKQEPEFVALVRSGGSALVITIPKEFMETFNIQQGKSYRVRFLDEVEE